jgi:hypothetical protein
MRRRTVARGFSFHRLQEETAVEKKKTAILK